MKKFLGLLLPMNNIYMQEVSRCCLIQHSPENSGNKFNTCWGIWTGFSAGAMFLTTGVICTAWPLGTACTMFTLGAMCRTLVAGPVGVANVNWGAVPDCIFARDVAATLMGTIFWSCTGTACLLGEPPAFGAIFCFVVALNGWTWTKVHVMLPPVPVLACAPVKVPPALDKGVSLIGLPDITTRGGLAWPPVVTVLTVVDVPEAPERE